MFFAHLSIEKLCKALWVLHNEPNHPPRIHNLVYLLSETKIELSDEEKDFFLLFNEFQLEGRYPDYKLKVHQSLNENKTTELLSLANKHRQWLLSKLQ